MAAPPPAAAPPRSQAGTTAFKDVRYYLDEQSIDHDTTLRIEELLRAGGAVQRTSLLNPADIDYVITNNYGLRQLTSTGSQAPPLVTPQWVLRSHAVKELLPPAYFSPDPDKIFSGVWCCFSGISSSDLAMMWQVIEALGGKCQGPLDRRVTHLVLCEPRGDKYNYVRFHPNLGVAAVKPDWVQDSYNLRKRQPESAYALAEPTALDLRHMVVHLRDPSIPEYISVALARARARIEPNYSPLCTHVVMQYRDTDVFPRAVQAGQHLVTLHWLKRLLCDRVVAPPTDSVLDFPAPEHPVPGASDLRISITGFLEQRTRRDLEDLITVIGAQYDTTMTRETTHLVAASLHTDKAAYAAEWGLTVVAHTWLQEAARTWRLPPPEEHATPCYVRGERVDAVPASPPPDYRPRPFSIVAQPRQEEAAPVAVDTPPRSSGGSDPHVGNSFDAHATPPPPASHAQRARRPASEPAEAREPAKRSRRSTPSSPQPSSPPPDAASGGVSLSPSPVRPGGGTRRRPRTVIAVTGLRLTDAQEAQLRALPHCEVLDKSASGTLPFTHLVAAKVARTKKFLQAVCLGASIVTSEWVDACIRAGAVVDEGPYALRDGEAERLYDFSLAAALERARAARLLPGWVIAVTPSVRPDEPELAETVMHAGCAVVGWSTLKPRQLPEHLLLVSCEEDRELWPALRSRAPKRPILAVRAVTVGLLKQQREWAEEDVLVP